MVQFQTYQIWLPPCFVFTGKNQFCFGIKLMFLCLTGKSLGMSPILLLFAKPLLLVHCHVFCSVYIYIYILYTCSSCIAVISFDRRAIMTYYHPLTNVDPENCQCLEQSSLLTSTIGRVHVSWRVCISYCFI